MSTGNETPEELVALLTRAGARTSGDYETTVRASLIDRAAEYIKSTLTPPELENFIDPSVIAQMVPPKFQMAEEPADVRDMVLEMREFFLTLVSGFNAVGAYEAAVSAQAIAVALNTFEAMRVLTGLAWPLEVIRAEGEPPGLKTTDARSLRYGDDL